MRKLYTLVAGFLCSIFFAVSAMADEEIIIAIDGGIPPYVYPDTVEGIDVDIIKKAAELGGLKIKFLVSPYNRVERLLLEGKVQAAVSYTPKSEHGAVSQPIRYWFDGLIVRQGIDFSRENWANLNWSTFPAVEAALGDEILNIAPYLKTAEIIDNTPQAARMMHGRRTDVYVGDMVAFKHFFEETRPKENSVEFDVVHTYTPVPYYLMFVDKQNRDAFNRGLAALKESGQYEWIWAKHILFGSASVGF